MERLFEKVIALKRYDRTFDPYILCATLDPFCSDGMVTFGRAIRQGQMATFTKDFEELTGQKPITVRRIFEEMESHLIGSRTSTDK